jgi:hypothetical protein
VVLPGTVFALLTKLSECVVLAIDCLPCAAAIHSALSLVLLVQRKSHFLPYKYLKCGHRQGGK